MLLGVTYHMFFERLTLFYKILVISMVPLAVLNLFGFDLAGNAGIALSVVALIDLIRVTVKAIRNRKPGSWIVGSGVLIVFASILALVLFFVIVFATTGKTSLSGWLGATFLIFLIFTVASIILSIPLSMSVYLARSFASVNRSLKDQLLRVRQLSEEKLQQELEKKRLLEVRSEELERKVSERTSEVVKQKEEIEIKNKYLTDSINYARRIQTAILPAEEQYKEVFEEAFVLYLPKDIVSGDFYWMHKRNDLVFVAVADCTGHGISGAFMSMIGNTLLNEIIVEKGITETGHILDLLHEGIKKSLKQDGQNNANDGMDIAICRISPGIGEEVLFSGAMRPLYIGGAEGMREVRPDKFSIGGFREEERKFTTVRPEVKKGEMLYLFTDGYADQFGGEKGKKFMSRNFQKLLEQISGKAADEQKLILENTYLQWKGNNEQVDDILVVGVRMI
jgi:serine phosphatase RsbU (regulator of sigma subunit)